MLSKIRLKPAQALALGVLSYILIGTILISLPFSQKVPINFIDNLFTVVSAVSTTGLGTVSTVDSYTWFGQFVLIMMFQIGGWGFMTITSFFFLVIKRDLSPNRINILKTSYTLPNGFNIKQFILNTVIFTVIIEVIGTLLLWIFFAQANVDNALWSAFFHTVSAFATAGFSLNNNSLTDFSLNIPINIIISVLCYLGAIGFIVIQDFYLSLRKKRKITFTSKVILIITFVVYILGVIAFYFAEPTIQDKSFIDKFILSSFQVMTASTTAGFNSMDFGLLARSVLFVIIIIMIIGASPSGTGGGIKTTSISALSGIVMSILKKKENITFFGNEIPLQRVFSAVGSTVVYLFMLSIGIFFLCITDPFEFEKIFFEAASALGTVGLSMGITSSLSFMGKVIIIILMYIGRVGPLSLGIALFESSKDDKEIKKEDIAM